MKPRARFQISGLEYKGIIKEILTRWFREHKSVNFHENWRKIIFYSAKASFQCSWEVCGCLGWFWARAWSWLMIYNRFSGGKLMKTWNSNSPNSQRWPPYLRSKIVSFQSISDLNGAIASLADWGQKISCEFFEIKMKKFRKSMKHKGLVSNPCSKSAPREGLSAPLDSRSLKSQLRAWVNILRKRSPF